MNASATPKFCARAQAVVGNKPHITVRPTPEQSDDRSRAIREAVYDFCQRDPEEQAGILNLSLTELATDVVRDTSLSLVDLVPSLREQRIEADYNTALQKFVRQRAAFFGWSVSEQPPGGRTAKRTPGKPDIVISSGVATYAVIEGVVANRPVTHEWTKDILRQHLAKIFSYATCRIFFHVTYAEIDDPRPIIQLLHPSARDDVPPGLTYVDARDLPERGSSPPGFVAEYKDGALARTIYVVFLVLDVAQRRLMDAAAAGDELNPRNRKAKTTSATKTASLSARREGQP